MVTTDNIVKMPDKLSILAGRAIKAAHAYEAGIAKQREGHAAAIAAVIEYGAALLEGRKERPSNNEFYDWIKDNGIDRIKPFDQQQERTAAMKIAEIVQGSGALDGCGHNRPTHIMTWWRNQQREKNVKIASRKPRKVEAALADAKAFQDEHHRLPTERDMNERGHSDGSASAAKVALKIAEEVRAEEALKREQAIREAVDAEAAKAVRFTKAQQRHIDAAIRRRVKEFDKEEKAREASFEQRVRTEASAMFVAAKENAFPRLQERQNAAFRREETYRKMIESKVIFTEAEFGNIRFCLHPDNSASEEKRRLAFTTFNLKKLQLTGKP